MADEASTRPSLLARARLHTRGWSLRARLVLGLVLVAALGLTVADVIVYNAIEPYLLHQLDSQLDASFNPMLRALNGGSEAPPGVPVGTFAMLLNPNGRVIQVTCVEMASTSCPSDGPALSSSFIDTLDHEGSGDQVVGDVAAEGPGVSGYRILGKAVEFGNVSFVVAIPLTEVNDTLNQLILIELGVSLGVMAALIGLGYLVVRVGMRPLKEIEETAGAIAQGDLSRRIEVANDRTEIGRLGASLNGMLAQIEHAFTEQKASEDRLRQFLADASHELRTPVTSIHGYSELFRRGARNRPEDLELSMQRIEDEAVRMGVLVDDLLLLARLDQGRPIDRELVDLAALSTDVAADASVLQPDRPLAVDAPVPVFVLGDAQRLRQIVSNLVHNALQYTPVSAAINVIVRSSGEHALLVVADEGPGIAPDHAEHVFERFYRADPSRTRESGGSGLGLSIVASIAEAHGGSARLDTRLGEGATFVVELPLAHSSEDASPPAQARDEQDERSHHDSEPAEVFGAKGGAL